MIKGANGLFLGVPPTLKSSLNQIFVLLLQIEDVVYIFELKKIGGAPYGHPFAPLQGID